MKRRKELLWFLIPFLLLPLASIFSTLYAWTDATPSIEDYIHLFLNDSIFWVAVGNTLLLEGAGVAVLALVLGLAVRWLPLSRPLKYVLIFAAATLITATVWIVGMRLFPQWINLLAFLKYGNLVAFIVWLAECIFTVKRTTKQESEQI